MQKSATMHAHDNDALSIDQSEFKRSLTRIIVMSFSVTLLVAIALVVELDRNHSQGNWVFHSEQILLHIDRAQTSAADRARALASYLLTDEPQLLSAYQSNGKEIDQHLQRLHTAMSDNAVQTRRLDSLASQYWIWEASANEVIRRYQTGAVGLESLPLELRTLNSKYDGMMQQFRNTFDAEVRLRNERVTAYEEGSRTILLSIIGACLLIGIIASIFGRRQVRRLHNEFASVLNIATRSRDQLMAALLGIGDAIVMTDSDGVVQLMNHRAETMTGWSESKAIGKEISQVVSIVSETEMREHPESPHALPNPVEHALSENRQIIISTDALLVNRRGLNIPVEASATPILTHEHQQAGVVVVLRDISVRRAREDELFQREQEFRALAENSPDVTIRFSPDLRITYANSRIESVLGLPPRQVVGKTFDEIGGSAANGKFWSDSIQRVLASGAAESVEIEYVTIRGVRQFQIRLVPEIDKSGKIISIISVARDITDAKRSERELREREEQFRGVVENSLDAFYLLTPERDADGKIIDFRFAYVNDRGAEITTFKKQTLIGKRLGELMPGSRTTEYIRNCAAVVETGVPRIEEFMTQSRYVASDTISSNSTWLRSQFVKIGEGVAITSADVTERKQMEQSLRESEARYRRVVDGASEAIFSTDLKGRIIFANPFICALAGYPVEDVIGMNYTEFIGPEMRSSIHRFFLRQYLERANIMNGDFPFLAKNGDLRWLAVTSTLRFELSEESNIVAGFDIIGADVTTAKLETDRLRKIIQEAGMKIA